MSDKKLPVTITVKNNRVMFNVGVQHFTLSYEPDTKEEAEWMANQTGVTGEQLASALFGIHKHKPDGTIYYDEKELIEALKSIGLPEPDWKKFAEENQF